MKYNLKRRVEKVFRTTETVSVDVPDELSDREIEDWLHLRQYNFDWTVQHSDCISDFVEDLSWEVE